MTSIDSVNRFGVTSSVNGEETLRDMILSEAPIPSPQEASLALYLATTGLHSLDLRGLEFSYAQLEKVLKLCPFVQRITVPTKYEAEAFARKILFHIGCWGNEVGLPSIFRAPLTFCHEATETSLEKVLLKLTQRIRDYTTEELFRLLEFFLDPKHIKYAPYICVELLGKFKEIEVDGQIMPRNLPAKELARVICYAAKFAPSFLASRVQYFIEKLHEEDENGRSKLSNLEIEDLGKLSKALFSEVLVCERLYTLVADIEHRKRYYAQKGYPIV